VFKHGRRICCIVLPYIFSKLKSALLGAAALLPNEGTRYDSELVQREVNVPKVAHVNEQVRSELAGQQTKLGCVNINLHGCTFLSVQAPVGRWCARRRWALAGACLPGTVPRRIDCRCCVH
jgi:hypothetical protein